jgi:hypothetical protein
VVRIFVGILLFLHPLFAKEARLLRLDEKTVARIAVEPGRTTILSFPTKPLKVILGNRGLFGVEYVGNDVAISALSAKAKSNLFIYLDERRFAFDLVTVTSGGDEIILVRDALDTQMKVKFK